MSLIGHPGSVEPTSLRIVHQKRHSESDPFVSPGTSSRSPSLVRKKTGEIVKSSLKLSSLGNFSKSSQSLPTTPTGKSVHFNNRSFVDVKYFRENESPTAISVLGSPREVKKASTKSKNGQKEARWFIGDSDSELESESDSDLGSGSASDSEYDAMSWHVRALNFKESYNYSDKLVEEPAVFLERVMLNQDRTVFKGNIAVKNIAFEKKVVLQYSVNNWKIIQQTEAFFNPDEPRILRKNSYDRFSFSIPMKSLVEGAYDDVFLECCVRYQSGSHTYWDNNRNENYKIVLTRTPLPTAGDYTTPERKAKKKSLNASQQKFVGEIQASLSKLSLNNNDDYSDSEYSRFAESNDSYFPPFNDSTYDISKDDLGDSLVDFKYTLDLTGPGKENKNTLKDNFCGSETLAAPVYDFSQKKPSFDSEKYKEIVNNYCFFRG